MYSADCENLVFVSDGKTQNQHDELLFGKYLDINLYEKYS